mmetsp:Transcript_30579/g.34879  ORF Transcript_30579/g.34879 Transcript_30579/m.34879 type:complete len:494 (+) Transcript_30579:73-1554(+)|eukprot:CAMPEP_0194182052 /NCGR_PEP_ID=MMETSP0154-20130528/22119_1 /TAXON_ID=1049557 /ORGANISM="Thalassiothrix antarctica, Strain L6-D1" /LENGTH=493 /DNA_ID=CAMNT_0038898189 /DNA_START=72 /DNA_END=1553 /DNA_ORIENTATION=+
MGLYSLSLKQKNVVIILLFGVASISTTQRCAVVHAAEPPGICPNGAPGESGICPPVVMNDNDNDDDESSSSVSASLTAAASSFFDWIERHKDGYVNRQLSICGGGIENNGLRGVYWKGAPSMPTPEGTNLFRIPQSCFLTSKSITDPRTVIGQKITTTIPQSLLYQLQYEETTQVQLAIVLLIELENIDQSYWKLYLELLPKNDPSQPLFWKDHSELQSPLIVNSIMGSLNYLQSKKDFLEQLLQVTELFPSLTSKKDETSLFDLFVWSFYLVSSRAFQFTIGGTSVHAMVPLADLINHGFPTSDGTMIEVNNNNFGGVEMLTSSTQNMLSDDTELFVEYQSNESTSTAVFLYRYGIVNADYETYTKGDYIILRYGQTSYTVHGNNGSISGLDSSTQSISSSIPQLQEKIQKAIQYLPTSLEDDKKALLIATKAAVADPKTTTTMTTLLIRIRYKQILHKLQNWIASGAPPSLTDKQPVDHSDALYWLDITNY